MAVVEARHPLGRAATVIGSCLVTALISSASFQKVRGKASTSLAFAQRGVWYSPCGSSFQCEINGTPHVNQRFPSDRGERVRSQTGYDYNHGHETAESIADHGQ